MLQTGNVPAESSIIQAMFVLLNECSTGHLHYTRGLQPCSWRDTVPQIYRFQIQPQSNTPEPANQALQGYVLFSDRCVRAGLELKAAGL